MNFSIGFYLKTVSNLSKKRIDYLSKDTELTGFQGYVMGYLINEGRNRDIFQKDVEKHLEISRASVTSVLQLLEKNGFIRRESVDSDARLKKITVTEKGYQAHEYTDKILEAVDASMKKEISEEELEIFLKVLKQMKNNLEQDKSTKISE